MAGFSRSRRIGEGGFGQVFAGDLLCSSSSSSTGSGSSVAINHNSSASPPDPSRSRSSSPSPSVLVAVAVKLLEPGSLQGEAEFEAEVRALRGREPNPHLVRLLGICVEGGRAGGGSTAAGTAARGVVRAAVLERVEGGESVAEALEEGPGGRRRRAPFPWAERVAVAAGAASGLAALHAGDGSSGGGGGGDVGCGGIAHGDVSAMNVLVARRRGQPVTGVLCDLGLSGPARGPPPAARGRAATRG